MKLSKICLLLSVLGLFISAPAQAALVHYETVLNHNHKIEDGFSKKRFNTPTNFESTYQYDYAVGKLAAATDLTFTYTIKSRNALDDSIVSAYGAFTSGNNTSVTPGTLSLIDTNYGRHGKVRSYTYQLILTLANLGDQKAKFLSYLSSAVGDIRVRTSVAASAVPLPAALPLFGLGLVGLAGIKRLRKSKAAA